MAMEFNDYACELADVDRITPENRDDVLEKLNRFSYGKLAEKAHVARSTVNCLRSILGRNPLLAQKKFLKTVYYLAQKYEGRILSSKEIYDYLRIPNLSHSINLEFLELIGVIEVRKITRSMGPGTIRRLYSSIKVNLDMMKRYWPDIERWTTESIPNIKS